MRVLVVYGHVLVLTTRMQTQTVIPAKAGIQVIKQALSKGKG
jgi:hypothetical protein